jgi:hypothetical protein
MALRTLWFLRKMSLGFLFVFFKVKRLTLGVTHVESGPLVRNSYHAEQPIARCNFQFTSHSHKIWNCNQDHADTD